MPRPGVDSSPDRSPDERFDERLHAALQDSLDKSQGNFGLYHEDLTDEDLQDQDLADENLADLAQMREAIGNYRAETLRFAEQQSAAMPVPRGSRAVTLWHRTPQWAVASAAVLLLGCTSFVLAHRSTQPVPVAVAAAPNTEALNEDNRLLLSVDQALHSSIAPTEQELGLSAIPAHSMKHGRTTTN